MVVLDITMPGRSGLEVLREIKQSKPRLPVARVEHAPRKPIRRPRAQVRSLRLHDQGKRARRTGRRSRKGSGGRTLRQHLAWRKIWRRPFPLSQKAPQEKLSDREFQVLRLIASGKMVTDIARELSLSVKTISTYRSRILEKMGMKNNAELMHYAIQHRLVE